MTPDQLSYEGLLLNRPLDERKRMIATIQPKIEQGGLDPETMRELRSLFMKLTGEEHERKS
jgi:hypothetical protein